MPPTVASLPNSAPIQPEWYLREHITLGYATTLHAAQGITVGSSTREGACFTVLSDDASRAMAYVGTTRGKDENHAFIYQPITGESDHEHLQVAFGAQIHKLRRGNKYAAAHYFRMILANDDRPRSMHAEAQRTDRDLLPEVVSTLLARNDDRRAARATKWRAYTAAERARAASYERLSTPTRDTTERSAERARDAGDSLELCALTSPAWISRAMKGETRRRAPDEVGRAAQQSNQTPTGVTRSPISCLE